MKKAILFLILSSSTIVQSMDKNSDTFWVDVIKLKKPNFNPERHEVILLQWNFRSWVHVIFGSMSPSGGTINLNCPDSMKHLDQFKPYISASDNNVEIDVIKIEARCFESLPYIHQHPIKFGTIIGATAFVSAFFVARWWYRK